MKKKSLRLSLRYKILLVLTVPPLLTLSLYLMMATRLFESDKMAYVSEASVTVSRSLANQVQTEMLTQYAALRSVAQEFDPEVRKFGPSAQRAFDSNPLLQAVLLFGVGADGGWQEAGRLYKSDTATASFLNDKAFIRTLQESADHFGAHLAESSVVGGSAGIAFRLGEAKDLRRQLIVGLYKANTLVAAFGGDALYRSLLITKNGEVVIGGATEMAREAVSKVRENLRSSTNDGSMEVTSEKAPTAFVSYAGVGVGDLAVVSFIEKGEAMKAVGVLLKKSFLFLIGVLAAALVISILASNRMTSALRDLFDATTKIADGDFTVQVPARSDDEVGSLAERFNTLAGEVSRRVSEAADRARSETELDTIKTLQESLFPSSSAQFGPVRVVGHFEPSSRCGGDWWSYSRVGSKFFVWIGDAAGFGTPAALMTSAVCSAASVISSLENMTPSRALKLLNRAVRKTSKDKMSMSFFIACIDVEKQIMTYANASHEAPLLMRASLAGLVTKKDLVPLNEVNGPILGANLNSEYEEAVVELKRGDQLLFFTDGLLEIQDESGKKWNERLFADAVMRSANWVGSTEDKVSVLRNEIASFRHGSDLSDDVTFVMCEFTQEAS